MIDYKIVYGLILTIGFTVVPVGCMHAKENNLATTSEKGGVIQEQNFPPGTVLRLDPDYGTIQYLKGKNLSMKLSGVKLKNESPIDIAYTFLELHKSIFKLEKPRDELLCTSDITDELGLKHVRFQQIFHQVPVWSKELNVHLDQDNNVYLVQGRYISTPHSIHTRPVISTRKAVEKVIKEMGVKKKPVARDTVELVIYVEPRGKAILAYMVPIPGWIFFVDAVKGDIVHRVATLHT